MPGRSHVRARGLGVAVRLVHTELITGIFGFANTIFAAFAEPLLLALTSAEALFQVNTLGIGVAIVHGVTRVDHCEKSGAKETRS